MKRPYLQRFFASAILIGAMLGTASVAQARPDVQVSIGLPGLPGLPVFVAPPLQHPSIWAEPVYVQPRAVYEAPPAVYERPWRPSYRYASSPRYIYDRDHDGVPNRYDRDRDGDGVPNRYDRRPDNPYRR